MTEIEEELIATLADVRRARNEAADLVVRTARERDAAVARAEAAEARIAAIETQLDAGYPTAFTDEQREGFAWLEGNLRAALAEPVEPQPSACATCGGTGWMPNPLPPMTTATDGNPLLPCPSCTPPDPESETT